MQAIVKELDDKLAERVSDILQQRDFKLDSADEREKAVAFVCKLLGFDDVQLASDAVEEFMIDKDKSSDVRQVRTMQRC